jgi:hypothetical protein
MCANPNNVNSYVSASATQQILHWEQVYDVELNREVVEIYLPGFNVHDRIRDMVSSGQYRNRMVHTLSISIRTRASFAIYFSFEFFVDTIPLDVEAVERVQMGFANAESSLIEREVGGGSYESGQMIDIWKEYGPYRSSTAAGGVSSATTISYERSEVMESYSELTVEERSEEQIVDSDLIESELPPYFDRSRGGDYGGWPEIGAEVRLGGRLMRQWDGRPLQFPALYDEGTGLLFYLRGNFSSVSEGEYIVVRGVTFGQVHEGCGVDIIDVSLEGPRESLDSAASYDELLQLVANDMAERLRIRADRIKLLEIEQMSFINGVQGSSPSEIQIMGGFPIDGYRITLAADADAFIYDADVRRSYKLRDARKR